LSDKKDTWLVKQPVPLTVKGSLPKPVEEENRLEQATRYPDSTGKRPLRRCDVGGGAEIQRGSLLPKITVIGQNGRFSTYLVYVSISIRCWSVSSR